MDLLWRKRREEEGKSQGRLPPGQRLTDKWPVLHYGPVAQYNTLENWDFKIWGLVEKPLRFNWEEFNQLPKRKITLDMHCVTTWSRFDTEFEGVHLQDLIDSGMLTIKPEAKFCIQHAEFDYTTNTALEVVLSPQFLFVTTAEGKPLTPEHGYPLRGLMGAIPGQHADVDRYLWKGAKWIRGLEFSATDKPGFWEQAGYSNTARVWNEERYWR